MSATNVLMTHRVWEKTNKSSKSATKKEQEADVRGNGGNLTGLQRNELQGTGRFGTHCTRGRNDRQSFQLRSVIGRWARATPWRFCATMDVVRPSPRVLFLQSTAILVVFLTPWIAQNRLNAAVHSISLERHASRDLRRCHEARILGRKNAKSLWQRNCD